MFSQGFGLLVVSNAFITYFANKSNIIGLKSLGNISRSSPFLFMPRIISSIYKSASKIVGRKIVIKESE